MDRNAIEKCITIQGGIPLSGVVKIQGSKNAVLPIIAACVLTADRCLLKNCPKILDVYQMMDIIKSLGGVARFNGEGLFVDTTELRGWELPEKNVRAMRSGLCFLGALLGQKGKATFYAPGGCVIGERPIDIHLRALEKLGIDFQKAEEKYLAVAPKGIIGKDISLRLPSVGATENIIMAAVKASGMTRIFGAAREPEIVSLCDFLNKCGACITGAGESVICVKGVEHLSGCEYEVPADRIVAGTYAIAVAASGGAAFLEQAPIDEMTEVLSVLKRLGSVYEETGNGLYIAGPPILKSIDYLKTKVYPGFPTDLQSVLLPALSVARGDCIVEETLFENRFGVTEELMKLSGKYVKISNNTMLVLGGQHFVGGSVKAMDLRAGAALVVAGIIAAGVTTIYGVNYIERGYENICRDLGGLGARISMNNGCGC